MAGDDAVREQVRQSYARAARVAAAGQIAEEATPGAAGGGCGDGSCCSPTTLGAPVFGATLYDATQVAGIPRPAALASLGCGNPTAVAELRAGERVLDLGSGGGIDVLLSAGRVGPTGFVYGVDMTEEMLELARDNAAQAGVSNVEFRQGAIEDLPLDDAGVDVVISNCVINLSTDKAAVLSEAFRVLAPGGRLAVSDVVAEDRLSPAERAERGTHVGCVAGALSHREYLDGLARAGFVGATVEYTHEVADGMHGAVVRAVRPVL